MHAQDLDSRECLLDFHPPPSTIAVLAQSFSAGFAVQEFLGEKLPDPFPPQKSNGPSLRQQFSFSVHEL